jgi:hypothetical protein
MAGKVVPMIHVPDVRATVAWYQDIGFTVIDTYGDEGEGLICRQGKRLRSEAFFFHECSPY